MNLIDKLRYIELSCHSIILECDLIRKGVEPFEVIEKRINLLYEVIKEENKRGKKS